jgi:hypothetical protein
MPINGRGVSALVMVAKCKVASTRKDEAQRPNGVLWYRHQGWLRRGPEIVLTVTKHAIKLVLGEKTNQLRLI